AIKCMRIKNFKIRLNYAEGLKVLILMYISDVFLLLDWIFFILAFYRTTQLKKKSIFNLKPSIPLFSKHTTKKNLQVLYEDNHLIMVNKRCGDLIQGDKTGDKPLNEVVKSFLKIKYNKPGNVYL